MLNTDAVFTIIAVVFPLVELLGIIATVHAVMNVRSPRAPLRGIRDNN